VGRGQEGEKVEGERRRGQGEGGEGERGEGRGGRGGEGRRVGERGGGERGLAIYKVSAFHLASPFAIGFFPSSILDVFEHEVPFISIAISPQLIAIDISGTSCSKTS
jgi:hypothetical protein